MRKITTLLIIITLLSVSALIAQAYDDSSESESTFIDVFNKALCNMFDKVNNQAGCDPCGDDNFCNEDFCEQGADPDCVFDTDNDGVLDEDDCAPLDGFTFFGAREICFDGIDNGCDNGLIDGDDPDCAPDGLCDFTIEGPSSTDCQPTSGNCPLFDESLINDIESVLGPGKFDENNNNPVCSWNKNLINSAGAPYRLTAFTKAALNTANAHAEIDDTISIGGGTPRRQDRKLEFLSVAETEACATVILNACG